MGGDVAFTPGQAQSVLGQCGEDLFQVGGPSELCSVFCCVCCLGGSGDGLDRGELGGTRFECLIVAQASLKGAPTQGSLEVKQNSVPEMVLASPAVPEAP